MAMNDTDKKWTQQVSEKIFEFFLSWATQISLIKSTRVRWIIICLGILGALPFVSDIYLASQGEAGYPSIRSRNYPFVLTLFVTAGIAFILITSLSTLYILGSRIIRSLMNKREEQ